LKKSLDSTIIQDVALELGIDPAFIEKDWYAVQLLVLISELQSSKDVKISFSGGTSLYGLMGFLGTAYLMQTRNILQPVNSRTSRHLVPNGRNSSQSLCG